jgi:purine-binding chemotaxis protein CheW
MSAGVTLSAESIESLRLQELRKRFDQTFARAPATEAEPLTSVLALHVGNSPFVLRTEHITGIVKLKQITPFPSSIAECIGLAGVRGLLVPVFHLAPFLNLEFPTGGAHWLVLANRESPVGLAFEDFEGQIGVSRSGLYFDENCSGLGHPRLLARIGISVRPVIEVPQIVEEIRRKAGPWRPAGSDNP